MPWLCLCKKTNKDDAAACAECHEPPILRPVVEHRADAQTFEQFVVEDFEKTILPAYKAHFEDTGKTAGMRLHVARALLFARALRGYYDKVHDTAADAAAAGDLAVRFAVALHQFGKLWKVKERVIRIDDSAEQPSLVAVKPAREWKTASQSWATTYLTAIGLSKEKVDAIAALVGNTPPKDDVNAAIVRDAYLLERMRKEGGFDASALNSFIKTDAKKDALLADVKALIDDTTASLAKPAWKTQWDEGGSCMRLLAEAVRAKSPDRSAPKFLHQHALRDEPVVNHLGTFNALADLASKSGGAFTAGAAPKPEAMKAFVDYASQRLGRTIQVSFFPEPKVFCLGWDSGAVVEKRGSKYFLKTIYVHAKIPMQPVYLHDSRVPLEPGEVKAAIPGGKHKCALHRDGADCTWLVYDMAAKDLELSRLLTVSVSACSVACVWDQGATKVLLSHINAAAPIPVGMMAHLEKLPAGPHALRMFGSFYGSASEKKKFTTDLPYNELPFSRVLVSRSMPEFEAFESPPALTHPVIGLDFSSGTPAWTGEYGASGLGGIAGGVKILLGETPQVDAMRKELVYYTQTQSEIASSIKESTKLLNTKPVSEENRVKWLKQIEDCKAQKPLVGKTPFKLAVNVIMTMNILETGQYGFGPLWKMIFAAVKTKDSEAPLLARDATEVGGCLDTFLAHKGLPESDLARRRAAMLLFLYIQTGRPNELNAPVEAAFLTHYLKFSLPLTDAAFANLAGALPKLG